MAKYVSDKVQSYRTKTACFKCKKVVSTVYLVKGNWFCSDCYKKARTSYVLKHNVSISNDEMKILRKPGHRLNF